MGIEKYYQTLTIESFTKGSFDTPSSYDTLRTFKGLVQVPNNSNTFVNGKDTSSVDGILFTSINEVFNAKDLIVNTDGTKYIIAGQQTQPTGITGITPQRGQHVEYALTFENRGLDNDS